MAVLLTIDGVRVWHNLCGWLLCCCLLLLGCCACAYSFFLLVLEHTSPAVPAAVLLLHGAALCPLSLLLGLVVRRPDALIISVPVAVFVTMLPGLLYNDLAFDVQRTRALELLLCLLPASGAAMALRELFSLEAVGAAASWLRPAVVSGTPLAACAAVLLLDAGLYSYIALAAIDRALRRRGTASAAECAGGSCYAGACSLLYRLRGCCRRLCGSAAYMSLPVECDSRDGSHGGLARDAFQLGSPGVGGDAERPGAGATVLSVSALSKQYVRAGVAVPVIADFSAELRAGSVACLLGSNGAGAPPQLALISLPLSLSNMIICPPCLCP